MIRTPYIVRETAAGLERLAIPDILFQLREVQFIGEINAEAVDSLILQLRYLEHVDPEAPITMYINSPGGTVPDGLALYNIPMQAPEDIAALITYWKRHSRPRLKLFA